MKKQEFAKFAMALKTYYPKEPLLPNNEAMELWYQELQDIDYQVATTALRLWVNTNKWSPSIAEIRETAASVSNERIPDWSEGWEELCTAIRRYGQYQKGLALASLSPLTRECAERLDYCFLCRSENVTTDRANFRTVYESLVQREKKAQQIAPPLRELIGLMQGETAPGGVLKIEGKKAIGHDEG